MAPRLGTGPEDLPARLPVPACDVGIIAGDRWLNPLGPLVLSAPHDGTVSVDQTRLPGMKDHLVVYRYGPAVETLLEEMKELIELGPGGKVTPIPVETRRMSRVTETLHDLNEGRILGRVVLVP